MAERKVLDASAVLAAIKNESGSDKVRACLPGALISTVNLCEVLSVLNRDGIPGAVGLRIIRRYGLELRDFSLEHAQAAAAIYTREHRQLSLGDRACMALGISERLSVITSDTAWRGTQVAGLRVELIR